MSRRPGQFDTLLFADYSGAASPSAQKRAIALWRLDRRGRPRKVHGPFTRDTLREAILAALVDATRAGRRVLFGLDHQWSWPRDLWAAAGLAGRPWREALRSLVSGDGGRPPLGPAHSFPAAFNAWAGEAIFHCRVRGLARTYGVPARSGWTGDPVRLAERAMPGAKPATRLGGTGAVAGQTLVGLVELHRLLEDARRLGVPVLAWPMDALADDGDSHVGCEIYPSFCRPPHVEKTDDADARWTCLWASRADLAAALDLTRAPARVRQAARLEGWILGAPAPHAAVVLKWSRARKRYERQGLLVEEDALHEAEASCLADEEARARRRERAALRRAEQDEAFVSRFAARVRELFPGCPQGRESAIAEHACEKYSGRVGRSAAARSLDDEAVSLAVVAHVRHRETAYDEMLADGEDRQEARALVRAEVETVLDRWGRPPAG